MATVRERLASTHAFALTVIDGEKASAATLESAAARIGVPLPAGLSALYQLGVSLYWRISDPGALGYEEGSQPEGGQLELVPLADLQSEDELVRFTNDGHGNGFCLDLRRGGAVLPIVSWDHDDRVAKPFAPSFDAFFRDWAALGFAIDHAADGDLEQVSRFLETGKLPRKKPAPEPILTARATPLPRALRPLPADLQLYAAALLPDGEHVLTGGASKVVRRVRLADARIVAEIPIGHYVYSVASNDGRLAVCAGEGGVHLLDLETGTVVRQLAATPHHVVALAMEGDEATVIAGARDGTLAAFALGSGVARWRTESPGPPFASVGVSASGTIVAHTSDAKSTSVVVHDPNDGKVLARIAGDFLRPGNGVAIAAGGDALLVPIGAGAVARVALAGDHHVTTPPGATSDGFMWYRVAPLDPGRVVVGRDGAFEVWDLEDGRVCASVAVESCGVPSAILPRDARRVLLGSYLGWLGEWTLGASDGKAARNARGTTRTKKTASAKKTASTKKKPSTKKT